MHKLLVGDTVQLKKPHACGTNEWSIQRMGADVRIICTGCGQDLRLSRLEFMKRVRRVRTDDGRFVSIHSDNV